jgi:hypothetical protein
MAIILMVIDGYSIGEYWWLLLVIILMAINGYYISGYWWLLVAIGGYLCLFH